jgi:hypothetical protein
LPFFLIFPMAFRFSAFALAAFILAFAVLAAAMNAKSAYAADDLWYVGEGVKQDMYVKYSIQELDTTGGNPYVMTIYFKEQQDGNWMAPTFVEYNGKVISGTLKLADNMGVLSGGPGVPDEMRPFVSGYQGSLQWLDAFTTRAAPLSLKAGSWGKIASIGGAEIKPMGEQKVPFAAAHSLCQADSCDATRVSWHKGIDNNIWVVNEFPFPVKAETFAEDVSGSSQYQFKFELLEVGTGQPTPPPSKDQNPTSPQKSKTSRGDYLVELSWDPAEIRSDSTVTFGITMTETNGFALDNVDYNFVIKDSAGRTIKEMTHQKAEIGIDTKEVKFNSTGSMTVSVIINSVNGKTVGGAGGQVEDANFNVVVVPEFPVSAAIVAAAVVGMVVMMTRARVAGLFGARSTLL